MRKTGNVAQLDIIITEGNPSEFRDQIVDALTTKHGPQHASAAIRALQRAVHNTETGAPAARAQRPESSPELDALMAEKKALQDDRNSLLSELRSENLAVKDLVNSCGPDGVARFAHRNKILPPKRSAPVGPKNATAAEVREAWFATGSENLAKVAANIKLPK